ncbi:PAS sensor-containing signal transduction diguanylate cyclase [Oleiphilus messinensis]|uniref:diguanylate cyclase n=1 Tax=Oleiphilus messinensis TaxID=141451 RepID=A0A1Y0I8X3_9GAMM|nr:GGDEF domain-containing protein [Oleiphilus messinensis]ARU55833.1 PAS sensor-containing signal transduction diguanylate cyclase [Oleiphilus messinensis]
MDYSSIEFDRVVDALDLCVWVLGGDLQHSPSVLYSNETFAQWVSAARNESAGETLAFLFSPADRKELMNCVQQVVESKKSALAQLGFLGLDETHCQIDFVVKPLAFKKGVVTQCLLVEARRSSPVDQVGTVGSTGKPYIDGDDLNLLEQQTDPETGVYNRRYLFEQVERECLRLQRYGSPFAMLAVEIREREGAHGELSWNEMESQLNRLEHWVPVLAELVRGEFRAQDVIGRYQPDQFAVLMPETTEAQAQEVVDRLRGLMSRADNIPKDAEVVVGVTEGRASDVHFSETLLRLDEVMTTLNG